MGKWHKSDDGSWSYTHHGVTLDDATIKKVFNRMLVGASRLDIRREFGIRLKAVKELEIKFREWMT